MPSRNYPESPNRLNTAPSQRSEDQPREADSAWNPGLGPDIPPTYRQLESIYRPENVTTRIEDIDEISAQTGLSPRELAVFRPERLVLHELIIRVTADIMVLEGDD